MKNNISKNIFKLAKTPLGDIIVGLAFGKFSKVLPVKRIKETNKVIAFYHPKPYYQSHIVIVPKKPIKKLTELKEQDLEFINEVYKVAKEIVTELGWEKDGYSILVNGGKRQEVNQIHFHLYSGRQKI